MTVGSHRDAQRLTCGALVIDALERHGVDVAFGIPGTHTLALHGAIARSRIRHVAPRHEQGAGYAADAYARSTGRPGVCVVTSGPALMNIAAAAATAYHDSVPLLIISPGMPTQREGRDTGFLHEMKNQSAAMQNIVAWSRRVESLEDAGSAIVAAFEHFAAARPRPVHVEIPLDILNAEDLAAPVQPYRAQPAPAPDQTQISAAASLLRDARAPALLVGGGAVDAAGPVLALAERLDAVVVTTCNAKGVVPETHPLTLGASLRLGAARAVLKQSDVVLALGTEIAESDLWVEQLELSGQLVRVDIDEHQLQKNATSPAPVLGRADVVLPALLGALGPGPQSVETPAVVRADTARQLIAEACEVDGAPFSELHRQLRAALSEDAIVAGDSAQVSYYGTVHYFPMPRPRQFLYPAGFATLGYGLPAAIGAKLAFPEREVVCVMGDGGLMFTINEFATAVENHLALPIVVFNNNGYKEIKDEMVADGIAPLGVDLLNPDFPSLARAFGGDGIRLDGLAGFADSIRDALVAEVPTLIEIVG